VIERSVLHHHDHHVLDTGSRRVDGQRARLLLQRHTVATSRPERYSDTQHPDQLPAHPWNVGRYLTMATLEQRSLPPLTPRLRDRGGRRRVEGRQPLGRQSAERCVALRQPLSIESMLHELGQGCVTREMINDG